MDDHITCHKFYSTYTAFSETRSTNKSKVIFIEKRRKSIISTENLWRQGMKERKKEKETSKATHRRTSCPDVCCSSLCTLASHSLDTDACRTTDRPSPYSQSTRIWSNVGYASAGVPTTTDRASRPQSKTSASRRSASRCGRASQSELAVV